MGEESISGAWTPFSLTSPPEGEGEVGRIGGHHGRTTPACHQPGDRRSQHEVHKTGGGVLAHTGGHGVGVGRERAGRINGVAGAAPRSAAKQRVHVSGGVAAEITSTSSERNIARRRAAPRGVEPRGPGPAEFGGDHVDTWQHRHTARGHTNGHPAPSRRSTQQGPGAHQHQHQGGALQPGHAAAGVDGLAPPPGPDGDSASSSTAARSPPDGWRTPSLPGRAGRSVTGANSEAQRAAVPPGRSSTVTARSASREG